jgi:hypothetical protein
MERHFSTGISTIVAIMAAHRATSGREGAVVAFCQEEVDRIDAYLHETEPVWPVVRFAPTSDADF